MATQRPAALRGSTQPNEEYKFIPWPIFCFCVRVCTSLVSLGACIIRDEQYSRGYKESSDVEGKCRRQRACLLMSCQTDLVLHRAEVHKQTHDGTTLTRDRGDVVNILQDAITVVTAITNRPVLKQFPSPHSVVHTPSTNPLSNSSFLLLVLHPVPDPFLLNAS